MKTLMILRNYKYNCLGMLFMLGLISCSHDNKPKVEILKNNPYVDIITNPISAESDLDSTMAAKITFADPVYQFDTLSEGDIFEHIFHFTNTGKSPLSIFDARSTCGCTVAEYSKDIIASGGKGIVKVSFDSKGKTGVQDKPISLYANTIPQKTEVRIKGYVKVKNKNL